MENEINHERWEWQRFNSCNEITRLNGRNKIIAINTWVVFLMRSNSGIVK